MEMTDVSSKIEDIHVQPHVSDTIPPRKPKMNLYAVFCALVASMSAILLGYDIGVMSGAMIFIRRDLKVTDIQLEILAGILNLYALVGSCMAGRTSDWIGRRYTMVVAACFFFAGAILMGFSTNYAFLMFGRFVAGIGVGYGFMISPVYTAEVSPASIRGFLTSFTEVFVNVGILFGYVSNFAFSKLPDHLAWRFMLGVGAVPSVLLGLGVLAMPESPRWLVMQGRLAEAKKILDRVSESNEESNSRLQDIKEAAAIPKECNDDVVQVPKNSHGEGVWKELLIHPTKPVLHILISALAVHFFQQASGIDSVVLYSTAIFEKAGIKSTHNILLATVCLGLVKTISILIATFLLDKSGRRPLILTSIGGMTVFLALLGIGLTVVDRSHVPIKWAIVLCMASVFLFVSFFSMGMGPMTYVYCSEIFPLRLRAQGASLGMGLNRVMSAVISMSFISLYKGITIGGSFLLYAGIAAVGFVFFYVVLPETKGTLLEETESLFGNFLWKFSATKKTDKRTGEV